MDNTEEILLANFFQNAVTHSSHRLVNLCLENGLRADSDHISYRKIGYIPNLDFNIIKKLIDVGLSQSKLSELLYGLAANNNIDACKYLFEMGAKMGTVNDPFGNILDIVSKKHTKEETLCFIIDNGAIPSDSFISNCLIGDKGPKIIKKVFEMFPDIECNTEIMLCSLIISNRSCYFKIFIEMGVDLNVKFIRYNLDKLKNKILKLLLTKYIDPKKAFISIIKSIIKYASKEKAQISNALEKAEFILANFNVDFINLLKKLSQYGVRESKVYELFRPYVSADIFDEYYNINFE